MWSIILAITLMGGVAHEYVLPGYYETHFLCDRAATRIMTRSAPRDEVEVATIQCVEGWHVRFTTGGTNAD